MKVVHVLNGTFLRRGVEVASRPRAIVRARGVDADFVSSTPLSPSAPDSRVFGVPLTGQRSLPFNGIAWALEAMPFRLPCVLTGFGAFRGIEPETRASLLMPAGRAETLLSAFGGRRPRGDRASSIWNEFVRERLGGRGSAPARG